MAAAQFLATKQRLMEAPSGDKTQRGSEGILAKTSSRLKPGVSLPQQPPILPQNGSVAEAEQGLGPPSSPRHS